MDDAMNKWFRRTVGTVGIAGGIWLLGAGAAHADDAAVKDPQQLNGLFDEILTPAGGPNNLGLSLDAPDRKMSTGLVPGGPLAPAPHANPARFDPSDAYDLPIFAETLRG
jgi:hypothetical protein